MIFGALVILLLAIFLLSNREAVPVGFWPLGTLTELPLSVVVLVGLVLGVLVGLLWHLPARMGAMRRAKRAEKQIASMQAASTVKPVEIAPARTAAPPPA
ncbi:MAG TPA: lipopolysaccharide assembly protein LapA domain-containing protein [Acidiphilium sp.]|nr:lipopolysaccharide assembly protein LapA domain-containing protein [Acidiphilium sp.]HQU25092.1 lipopolysaccharide assembly protein LapA domain-containing protein [Acidiphilium sp.]